MSRSGYTDDYGDDDPLILGRWRGAVASAIRGKRGQVFLRETIAALDALPEKKLIANSFIEPQEGCVCALGAVGKARGIDLVALFAGHDPDDPVAAAASGLFGIARALAAEIMYENDEGGRHDETDERRFARVRGWLGRQLIEWEQPA